MIIGNGLLAKALKNTDQENVICFASGVSNSLEERMDEFVREKNLLKKIVAENPEKLLIYFSTCSIYDPSKNNSQYVLHKLRIEDWIKSHALNYKILRVGNAVGSGGNPNTLFNFISEHIKNGKKFPVYKNATRLLVDVEDLAFFVSKITHHREKSFNFAFPYQFSVQEIIEAIEHEIGKTGNYETLDFGNRYEIIFDNFVKSFFSETKSNEYLKKILKKYLII